MYALLPHAMYGHAVIHTDDAMHARVVASAVDEQTGDRIVELLNRFGITDSVPTAKLERLVDGPPKTRPW